MIELIHTDASKKETVVIFLSSYNHANGREKALVANTATGKLFTCEVESLRLKNITQRADVNSSLQSSKQAVTTDEQGDKDGKNKKGFFGGTKTKRNEPGPVDAG